MPKELKKLTFQLIGRASPYNIMKNNREALREQKNSDASFVGAMSNKTDFAESSVEFPRQLGSYADISGQKVLLGCYSWREDSDWLDLPYDEYFSYAPVVGKMKMIVGDTECKRSTNETCMEFGSLIDHLLHGLQGSPFDWEAIKSTIQNDFQIRLRLIYELYNIIAQYPQKFELLTASKPIFSKLVKCGAYYEYYTENEAAGESFNDLINYALDNDALNFVIAKIHRIKDEENYEKIVRLCVSKGADINMPVYCNEDFGSLLHYQLGYEDDVADLIQFYESLRIYGPRAQFNYEALDNYGRTPLLIAINSHNEKAAMDLLNLAQNGINVGIDIADQNGRTPLLIAAALGMKNIVELLLSLGANRQAIDKNGKGLDYYEALNEKETADMLSPLVNPYRSCGIRHSYLYWDDGNASPVRLCDKTDKENTGDDQISELVLLSEHKDHVGRLDEAIELARIKAEKSGNPSDRKSYEYFLLQREQIRGQKILVELCRENQQEVRQYLRTIKQEKVNAAAMTHDRSPLQANSSFRMPKTVPVDPTPLVLSDNHHESQTKQRRSCVLL